MTRFPKFLLPTHQILLPLMLPLRWRNYAMLPLLPLLPRENTTCKKMTHREREREREREKTKKYVGEIYNIWQHRQHTYFHLSFSRHYAIFRVAAYRQQCGNTWQHERQHLQSSKFFVIANFCRIRICADNIGSEVEHTRSFAA